MSVKTFQAIERAPTSIPIKDILSPEGIPHIFPEVESKGYFDIDYRADKLILVAGKYIGLIPINENVAVNIVPKAKISNLVHIISKSREYLDSLNFFEKYYGQTAHSSPTIFQFFANCLSIELRNLEREGVLKLYLQRSGNFPAPRGRINVGKTMAENWSKGKYYKVRCDYFEFTADNHYNRLIKFALWYCLHHLQQIDCTDHDLIKSLFYFSDYFESIPLDKNRRFLEQVNNDLSDQKLPILRAYYENVCKISRCIIEDIGIMLMEPGEDIRTLSFIIDMENIFEKYLLYVLRESFHNLEPAVTVLNGNKEGKGYLFKDTKIYEARPDIVVRYLGKSKLIIDAKYKNKVVETDRYQIISHALSFGADKAIMILPLMPESKPGLRRIGVIGGEQKIELFEYYFDLESQNLFTEENKYAQMVKDISDLNNIELPIAS